MPFEFELGSQVEVRISGEKGEVTGRSEFRDSPHQYCVDYVASDGRFTQNWFLAPSLLAK
jgi:hypothetical protein